MVVEAIQGETLDLICWRILGQTAGVTEQALALNPGIAAAGPILSQGQEITLPDINQTAPPLRETVNLWD